MDKTDSTPRGFEYKSKLTICGLPLLHISFRYYQGARTIWRAGLIPVPARGVIAIGQVAFGVVSISQFGCGVIVISQFALGVVAVSQFALAISAIAQFAICLYSGYGGLILNVWELISHL